MKKKLKMMKKKMNRRKIDGRICSESKGRGGCVVQRGSWRCEPENRSRSKEKRSRKDSIERVVVDDIGHTV